MNRRDAIKAAVAGVAAGVMPVVTQADGFDLFLHEDISTGETPVWVDLLRPELCQQINSDGSVRIFSVARIERVRIA